MEDEKQSEKPEDWREELPQFMRHFKRSDWLLWWALAASGIYGLAMIPFRAMLLVDHTFIYTLLTGSSLSVLVQAAENADRPVFLIAVILLATASALKFMPIFYFIGKRWGADFLDYQFMGKAPLWYRKMENFIYSRLGLCFFLSYIPFSPIPATVLVIVAAIKRVKGWVVVCYVAVFCAMLKTFYAYLGITFGTEVQGTLVVIDRYMTWISLGLLAYLFITLWGKNKSKERLKASRSDDR